MKIVECEEQGKSMAEAYFDRRGAEFFAVTKQVAIQGRSLNSVKTGRHTMQQRFCECGHSVLVAYVITKKGILHVYRVNARFGSPMRCPSCGKHVDINELR
jgi:hypothetical protein